MTLQIAELEPHVGDGRIKLEYRRTENQMGSISTEMKAEIQPSRVRYIKLGDGGRWEQECLDKRIIRLGFGSSRVDRFHLCDAGRGKNSQKPSSRKARIGERLLGLQTRLGYSLRTMDRHCG
jgi:hypothetical protein